MPHLAMDDEQLKPLVFIGSSRRELRDFTKAVRDDIGFDLYQVQRGRTPATAKPFKGLPGVMEIAERFNKDTYRAVYVADLGETVYVLHCFKKKSKQGVKTPKEHLNVIAQRYKAAKQMVNKQTVN